MKCKDLIIGQIKPIVLTLTLILVCAGVSQTFADDRSFTYVNYPGAINTFALGNNPAGDVVGAWVDAQWAEHGFVLRNGAYESFDFPGALWTEAYGISPRGDIVGQYGWHDGVAYTVRGFLFRKGTFVPIDTPGQQNTMPFKISPDGTIVGCNHHNVTNNGGVDLNSMMGFTLDPYGTSVLTITRSMNTGINPDGDVVGYSFLRPDGAPSGRAEISYLIRDGVMTTFQFPSAFVTLATDINAAGTIVGRYRPSGTTPSRGFILEDGEFEPFDVPGATQTAPFGISANGTVVGYYQVGTGSAAVYHGFLLSRAKRVNEDS